ncbi:hypothetical protein Tco_0605981 [Tanacetum coccineum]
MDDQRRGDPMKETRMRHSCAFLTLGMKEPSYEVLLFKWRIIYDSVKARIVAPAEKEAGTDATATYQEARNTAMEQLTTAS